MATNVNHDQYCRRLITDDPEMAHEWLRNNYCLHRAQLSGDVGGFSFTNTIVDFGRFSGSRVEHSMTMRAVAEPTTCIAVTEIVKGRFHIESGRDITAAKGGIVLYPPGVALHSGWSNISAKVLLMRLADLATEVGGPGCTLQFEGLKPVSPLRARAWHSLSRHVTQELSLGGAARSSELVRDGIFRLLAATLVETFPIRIPVEPATVVEGGASPVVRRAVAFIEANAGQPIGVREIAEAARIGPRGLGAAFRRHLDATPVGYLRRVRLDGAHQDLKTGNPSVETVAQIAARWGFGHHGRFSELYRSRYRCPPSTTLRT